MMEPTTYAEAQAYLAGGRDKTSRPVANNTRIERREDGRIACKYHATDVVTYHPDGSVTLCDGGWQTYTTKDRLNRFSPAQVWSEGGRTWAVNTPVDSARYEDGVTIAPDGSLQAHKSMVAARGQREPTGALRRRIRSYALDYARAFIDGKVDDPGLGDCLGCAMREVGTDKPVFGTEHLLSHVDEGYYVPSLLWNAIAACQYPDPAFIWSWWRIHGSTTEIARVVRKYMYRQLGMVS